MHLVNFTEVQCYKGGTVSKLNFYTLIKPVLSSKLDQNLSTSNIFSAFIWGILNSNKIFSVNFNEVQCYKESTASKLKLYINIELVVTIILDQSCSTGNILSIYLMNF